MVLGEGLTVRKKLSYSNFLLITLLALMAGIASWLLLERNLKAALWNKGGSLSSVLCQPVTSAYLSDKVGFTSSALARSLEFFRDDDDNDVSMAAVVAFSSPNLAPTVKAVKNFGDDPLDAAAMAEPLGKGALRYETNGFMVVATPLSAEGQLDPGSRIYQILVLNEMSIRRQSKESLRVSVLLGLVMLVLGFVTSRFQGNLLVSRPLERLLNGIRSNSAAQTFQPVQIVSRDEFGYLAESFNTMMQRLKDDANHAQDMLLERERLLTELADLNTGLEQRVAARTNELQREVAEHKVAEGKLLLSEDKFRTLFNVFPLGIARNSMDGTFIETNASFSSIVGYPMDKLSQLNYWALTPDAYADQESQQLMSLRTTGRYGPYEKEYIHSDGQLIPVRLNGVMINGINGEQYIWSIVEDISQLKYLADQMRIAAAAFESQEGMMITDANNVILRVNRAFTEITGFTSEDAVGRTPSMLKSNRHEADFFRHMWERINTTGGWQGEIWDRRKNGEEYQKWLTISAVKDHEGAVTHYIGVHHDITNRKLAEERIRELAFFDQLTGLPNRTLLRDRLKQAMAASARTGSIGGLLFIDLDNFKSLNDTLGHDMGDLLLTQVAKRLARCVREADTVARLGGDEFVVMLASLSATEVEAAAHTRTVCEKILSTLSQPYQLGPDTYRSTASLGATLFSGDLAAMDVLMKQADLAMYKSKEEGRNAVHFFDPRMECALKARAVEESDLRLAVEEKQFVLHYQAQVVDNGRIIGAEALVRWQHPVRGLVYPDDFIPLSEETELILPLGSWVLDTACDQLAVWAHQPEMADLTIAVNVSAHQLRQSDFVERVLSALARSGARPNRLKLELTESVLITNPEDIIAKMKALKAKGIGFSMDDFGTGYSSLSYLKRLPLDQLKIDRGFVKDILTDPIDAAIARMIIGLGNSLGLAVIAEGVEIEAQRDVLIREGCHAFQGYLYSRPLPLGPFEDYVKQAAFGHHVGGGRT